MATKKLPMGAKTAFVRDNPDATAQQVVELAKKKGISLTLGHVYNIRSKAKSDAATPENGAPQQGRQRQTSLVESRAETEKQFRLAVLRVGFDRAEQLIDSLKSTLAS